MRTSVAFALFFAIICSTQAAHVDSTELVGKCKTAMIQKQATQVFNNAVALSNTISDSAEGLIDQYIQCAEESPFKMISCIVNATQSTVVTVENAIQSFVNTNQPLIQKIITEITQCLGK